MSVDATVGKPLCEILGSTDLITAGPGFSFPVMGMMGYGVEQRCLESNPDLAVQQPDLSVRAQNFLNDFNPT